MTPIRVITALAFISVGIAHFTNTAVFVSIMPDYLPWHVELVLLSGVLEIVGGAGLLLESTRRFASAGLLLLLVAVFPANINMLVNEIYLEGMVQERWLLWARLPFQLVFAYFVFHAGGWLHGKSVE